MHRGKPDEPVGCSRSGLRVVIQWRFACSRRTQSRVPDQRDKHNTTSVCFDLSLPCSTCMQNRWLSRLLSGSLKMAAGSCITTPLTSGSLLCRRRVCTRVCCPLSTFLISVPHLALISQQHRHSTTAAFVRTCSAPSTRSLQISNRSRDYPLTASPFPTPISYRLLPCVTVRLQTMEAI